MRDKKWQESWNEHIKSLHGLCWIPNEKDALRVRDIAEELKQIVARNRADKEVEE